MIKRVTSPATRRAKRSPAVPPPTPIEGDRAKATVPPGHPLEMWDVPEAAARCRISEDLLLSSLCPRVKFGRRVLFDPIETMAFMRLHLNDVVSADAARGIE